MKGEYSTSLYTCTWVCLVNATNGQSCLNFQLWVYFQLPEKRGYTFFGYTLSSWLYLELVILFYWLYLPKKVQPIFKSIAKKRKYNKKKTIVSRRPALMILMNMLMVIIRKVRGYCSVRDSDGPVWVYLRSVVNILRLNLLSSLLPYIIFSNTSNHIKKLVFGDYSSSVCQWTYQR